MKFGQLIEYNWEMFSSDGETSPTTFSKKKQRWLNLN